MTVAQPKLRFATALRRFAASLAGAALFFLSVPTYGQTIRFSPGADAPIAINPVTKIYEEGVSFDPLVCAEQPCIELLHNIFEPLVATSEERLIEPRLATSWARLDGVTFRFDLRRGVSFHNGERFDAEAVRFSLERASDAYGGTAWFPRIAHVTVIDPYTVDVVLNEPDSLFLYRLANIGLVTPALQFRRVGSREFGRHPIGTGAFKFVAWDAAKREVVLERNENYWREGYPKVERLVYAYMDEQKALDGLIDGKLDLIRRLNPRKTTQFMRLGVGKIAKAWLPQLVLGCFNLLKPGTPLADERVREAINFAVNRDHLIRYGAIGNGRLLGGYTTPDDPNGANVAPYPYKPIEAQQLLKEAGYGAGFTLSMMVAMPVPPQIDKIISVSLDSIGISVSVKRVPESEFLAELYLPKFKAGAPPSFDILLLSVPAGTINHAAMVPMTLLYSGEPNESAIRDPVVDDLYLAGVRTYDPGTGHGKWRQLEEYVTKQNLLFIGYQERAVFGVNTRLQFTPRTLMTFWDAYYER
ncbi:MAG TPA: ABC transporter substrate-binding protein [Stellaceae bacterium]|nr:ABC transporter substrate-binding protein [Stellaceae bacterium]